MRTMRVVLGLLASAVVWGDEVPLYQMINPDYNARIYSTELIERNAYPIVEEVGRIYTLETAELGRKADCDLIPLYACKVGKAQYLSTEGCGADLGGQERAKLGQVCKNPSPGHKELVRLENTRKNAAETDRLVLFENDWWMKDAQQNGYGAKRSLGYILPKKKAPDWHPGWDILVKKGGAEGGPLPKKGHFNEVLKLDPLPWSSEFRVLDYWLQVSGYTTMWELSLKKWKDPNYREDGMRWDTPVWFDASAAKYPNHIAKAGVMNLITQFGGYVPAWWEGNKPYSMQTQWIFSIDWNSGEINEIADWSHFPSHNFVYATDAKTSSLAWTKPQATSAQDTLHQKQAIFKNPPNGDTFWGYITVETLGRYRSFTIPPSRNKGGDCKATTYKDVIAVLHTQWWVHPNGDLSEDRFIIFMARNVGWVYQMLESQVKKDKNGTLIHGEPRHLMHMHPAGIINQKTWDRMCADQYRDYLGGLK